MTIPRIFIDPGHGGSDPGAVGNSMRESDIVLEVAMHLDRILAGAGIITKMSRTTNVSPALRPQTANSWGADLLVSIHANAGGGTGVETVIPTASPRNPQRNLQECRRLAALMSNSIASKFGMRVRRANGVMLETETPRKSIGVLRESKMIAVLTEIAFIDSPLQNPDVNVLRNRRLETAHAIADSIFEFLGINPKHETPQSGVNVSINGTTLQVPAVNIDGRWIIELPEGPEGQSHPNVLLRVVLEAMGLTVSWDGPNNTIIATSA